MRTCMRVCECVCVCAGCNPFVMYSLCFPQIAGRIRMTVQDLGKSCIEVVQDAGSLQGNPTDSYAQRDLCDHARTINEKVGN